MRFFCALTSFILVVNCHGATFSDLQKTHWAYDAVEKAVEAGIIDGVGGNYLGNRLLNRFEMAMITAKILGKYQRGEVQIPASAHQKVLTNLQALITEFASELEKLNIKVAEVEEQLALIKPPTHQMPLDNSGFRAYAAFALVDTDKAAGGASRYSALGRE